MSNVACLLLCAGRSQRMQGTHKLLRPFAGVSLLRHVGRNISEAPFAHRLAVTGHQREAIEHELTGLDFEFAHNPHFASGMHSSIRVGVESLVNNRKLGQVNYFAICLADQPLLTAEDYELLIKAAFASGAKIIAPTYEGKRGNPVFISSALMQEILVHPDDDRGCHYLFQSYPNEIKQVEMPTNSVLIDVDTIEIYEEIAACN